VLALFFYNIVYNFRRILSGIIKNFAVGAGSWEDKALRAEERSQSRAQFTGTEHFNQLL
jgi:hypothetical protein